jgi:uncharacterized protein YndB with AHSA1/START domain
MTHELRFERLIDARPEAVFDSFTEPGGQAAFYEADEPGWIVRSECDLRIGGVWTVEFGPSEASSPATGMCSRSSIARGTSS